MRPRISLSAALLVLGAVLASPLPALAQTTAANKAAADALYDDGKRLIGEHKYDEALAKLLASQRLDPGIGTLLNIGFCYERIGKTASAWASYNEVAGIAKASDDKQGRAERAAQAAKALEPRLSKVVVTVASESRVANLEVRRDGDLVEPATWGTPIPVDPGTHTFAASAPGRTPWQAAVDIPAGPGTLPVAVPVLALGPPPAEAKLPADAWGTQRIAGVVVAGGGGLAVVAGAIFGGVTIAKKNALAGNCQAGDPYQCSQTGVDLHAQAVTMANASNVAFALGGAALATGAALFFTAPTSTVSARALEVRIAPLVAAETRGVWLTGRW